MPRQRKNTEIPLDELIERAKKAYIDANEITGALMRTFRPESELGKMVNKLFADMFAVKKLLERLE